MPIPQWSETLLSSDPKYKLYSRTNGSYMIMDTTSVLQVLEKHSQHQDIIQSSDAGYYHIKVDKKKTWVPILPGYTIFTKINKNIFQLSINVSEEQKIMFSWINFGENENDINVSNIITSNS